MTVVVWTVVGWAIFMALWGLFGILATAKRARALLAVFGVLLALLLLLELAVGIFVWACVPTVSGRGCSRRRPSDQSHHRRLHHLRLPLRHHRHGRHDQPCESSPVGLKI